MEYLKLLRVKHYIKNLLIFVPVFFAGRIFDAEIIRQAGAGFVCFSFLSSAIYIINDYRDLEKDRCHPVKKNRPIAKGTINAKTAFIIMILCIGITIYFSFKVGNVKSSICLGLYFALNIAYSMGLKNRPIIDVVILASGFVIRTFYGGFITGIIISKWLYLVVTAGSLFMGLGKRRNELKKQTEAREVLKYYNVPFLDKNMYVCVTLANVFYALWSLEMGNGYLIYTVPLFMIIMLCYSLDTERDSDGDPVELLLQDKLLMSIVTIYTICVFLMIYSNK